jgi:hypothetical protein
MLGNIDHLFDGNVKCFLIKIKGGKPGFIKKKFGKVVFISTPQYVRADILLDSLTTWVIRVLIVSKQMLDKLHIYFIILYEKEYVYFS